MTGTIIACARSRLIRYIAFDIVIAVTCDIEVTGDKGEVTAFAIALDVKDGVVYVNTGGFVMPCEAVMGAVRCVERTLQNYILYALIDFLS